MWRFYSLLLLLCVALTASAQQTKSNQELQKLFEEAEADYQAERYAEALEGYQILYKETGQINMVYNIAQCQRELKQYEAALASYQKFLKEQPASPKRREIETIIASMEEGLKEERARAQKKTELHQKKNRLFLTAGGLALASAATGTGALLVSSQAREEGNAPESLRIKGIALATASDVCLLGAGLTLLLALKTSRQEAALSLSPTPTGVQVSVHF